ncbi:TPA: DUF551 domain-containing protein [Enterobacter roggenkampii]|nr:DUF551 domain-containing protein [Enterobacter roggenkampii]
MSPITKEFTKEQLQQIIETDHVQCGEASALARIALASLEAEPVAWAHRLINKRNGVVHPWVYGSAEACPSEGDIFNIEVMPLYTAPPAPVSVPAAMEIDDDFDSAFEHGKAVGWNAYRAAMLQGADVSLTHEGKNHHEDKLGMVNHLGDANEKDNFPVIPDGWVVCSERMPEQFKAILAFNEYGEVWSGAYDRYWNFYCDNLLVEHVTHWMPLPAAPQQEA